MKQKRRMTRPVIVSASAIFLLSVIIVACRKTNDIPGENIFNAPAAKEWFYATFKKSGEYAAAATAGKQWPDWKTGRYKKTGNMELVEYDLVQQKKTTMVAPTGNPFEDKRIAEASVSRALFVRNGNDTRLYTVQFIPGADYARASGYDISKNTFTSPDKNFTGKLLIMKWNHELVRGYNIVNGEKKSVINKIVKENAPNRSGISSDCLYSYFAWYEQECTITPIGDNVAIENCTEWQLQWENITETYCPASPSECTMLGLDQEACMCQMLGICNGSGGSEDEACAQFMQDCENEAATVIEPENISLPQANFVRDTTIKWVVGKHSLNTWQVVANTQFITHGYIIGNQNYTHIQDVKTVSTSYEGSNAIIQTTWTEKSKTDNILVNNSTGSRTKSTVVGDLYHVCKRFPHPLCAWQKKHENLSNSLEAAF